MRLPPAPPPVGMIKERIKSVWACRRIKMSFIAVTAIDVSLRDAYVALSALLSEPVQSSTQNRQITLLSKRTI